MHPNGFIDQDPDALRLTLIEGGLDFGQFTHYASNAKRIAGVWVGAVVIGASHIISIFPNTFTFHEVFACVGVPNYNSTELSSLLVKSPLEQSFHGAHYQFSARKIAWSGSEPHELQAIIERANDPSTPIGLVQEFPQETLPAIPKTVITVYPVNGGIGFETAHSYPGDGVVVSCSTVTLT